MPAPDYTGSAAQDPRQVSLVIGTSAGAALELNQFRLVFQVRRGDYFNPNTVDVKVYNLSREYAQMLAQAEYTQLVLKAGYPGSYGQIFSGQISQRRIGRESQLDTYVAFTAADGDRAYNFATCVYTVPAGNAASNRALAGMLAAMQAAAGSQGITQGYAPSFQQDVFYRGRVYFGDAKDEIRDFCGSRNLLPSIQDGALTLIPDNNFIPGNPVVLSANTGMIGTPEQTINGIQVKCLLNPNIKIGQLVRIDGTVTPYRYPLDIGSLANNQFVAQTIKIDGAGMYYVMTANHEGDTRGQAWYSSLTCLSVDASVTAAYTQQLAVTDIGPVPSY